MLKLTLSFLPSNKIDGVLILKECYLYVYMHYLFVGLITFLGDKFKVISKVFVKKAIGTMDFAGYFLVLWCGLDIINFHSLSYVGRITCPCSVYPLKPHFYIL